MWTDLGDGAELAPAKVNLTLHVTGRRPDGYHMLDSFVVFPRVGDVLRYEPSSRLGLTLGGPFGIDLASDADNLVVQAAEFMGSKGALHLDKRLPLTSGIGGGSSDAAAVLRLLARETGLPMPADVVSLGADVPVCINPVPQRMSGIGEVITPLAGVPPHWMVLVNPGVAVSTPEVFRGLEQVHNAPCDPWPELRDAESLAGFLATQRNDLKAPAKLLCPVISECLDALTQADALLARMSGSGATTYGIFASESAALRAADRIRSNAPKWWVAAAPVN
ncbi:MAG: 4-(cytidine 5'-diphospho)-2-C-methyl-D-erythritol kinase [Pseudomonadota bacterium]